MFPVTNWYFSGVRTKPKYPCWPPPNSDGNDDAFLMSLRSTSLMLWYDGSPLIFSMLEYGKPSMMESTLSDMFCLSYPNYLLLATMWIDNV